MQSSLKILHVYHQFIVGGSEQVGLSLIEHSRADGHQCELAVIHDVDEAHLQEAAGRCDRIHDWTGLSLEDSIQELSSCLLKYDVVHFHMSYPDGVIGRALEKEKVALTVATCHLPNMDLGDFLNLDAIVPCCRYAQMGLKLPDCVREYRPILNGSNLLLELDSHRREAIRRELGLEKDSILLGRIGRVSQEKFPDGAYKAMAGVLLNLPTASAVIVGDGDCLDEMKMRAAQDGLEERMIFPGSSKDIAHWLSAFDLFVYYSDTDALPLSVIEAMGAGLPIIATDNAGVPELLEHERTGMMAPHGQWAEQVRLAVKVARAPELAKAIGEQARARYLQEFTAHRMCRQYAYLYEVGRAQLAHKDGSFNAATQSGNVADLEASSTPSEDQAEIVWSTADHGRLGVDGILECADRRVDVQDVENASVVNAPSPSTVIIRVPPGKRVLLAGALDQSHGISSDSVEFSVEDMSGFTLANLGPVSPGTSSACHDIKAPPSGLIALHCKTNSGRRCESQWIFRNIKIVQTGAQVDLYETTKQAVHLARQVCPGHHHAHSMYVQTHGIRSMLAIRCVATHLLAAMQKPKRIVIASFDRLEWISKSFPPWCELWLGPDEILGRLRDAGLREKALEMVAMENMFAKYAIPRLLMEGRVLVCDDDVIWGGPCPEMFTSKADYLFLEDPPGYYGPRSVEWFQRKDLIAGDAAGPPHLCAGMYLMNRASIQSPSIVSDIIENADSHRDEQSAVGMETRMRSVTFEVLKPPRYLHGGHGPTRITENAQCIHMQGWLQGMRDEPSIQTILLQNAIATHQSEMGSEDALQATLPAPARAPSKRAAVSVITCCHRFLQRLKVFIHSLHQQEYPLDRIEIVVADPESPDGLLEYLTLCQLAGNKARDGGLRAPNIIHVTCDPRHYRNRGYLINRAFAQSTGDVIVVADCDCIFSPKFLDQAVSAIEASPGTVLGAYRNFLSPETSAAIITGILDPIKNFEGLTQEDQEEEMGYRGVLGYCQVLARKDYARVMYPEEFDRINESDVVFVDRLKSVGVSAMRLKDEVVLHLHHVRDWEGVSGFM